MELIALEMKQRGMYLSRQLAFAGAEFEVRRFDLTPMTLTLTLTLTLLGVPRRPHAAAGQGVRQCGLSLATDAQLLRHRGGDRGDQGERQSLLGRPPTLLPDPFDVAQGAGDGPAVQKGPRGRSLRGRGSAVHGLSLIHISEPTRPY